MRRLRFGKYGLAEDPRGQHITWKIGEREYLAECVGLEATPTIGGGNLITRYFNGEAGPAVRPSVVMVLEDA